MKMCQNQATRRDGDTEVRKKNRTRTERGGGGEAQTNGWQSWEVRGEEREEGEGS